MIKFLILFVLLAFSTICFADDLDKLSGMEHWKDRGEVHADSDWKDWYKARIAWRRAMRVFLLEKAKNQRLNRGISALSSTSPSPASKRKKDTFYFAPQGDATKNDSDLLQRKREPQVPVERLDDSGQVIDEEGDRVLEESGKK